MGLELTEDSKTQIGRLQRELSEKIEKIRSLERDNERLQRQNTMLLTTTKALVDFVAEDQT